LNVTVTDGAGRLIADLTQDEFQVFEDNQPQAITVFSHDPQPIALSLLVDASTSMEQKLPMAQEAATGLIRKMKKADLAQVIDFNSEVQIRQDFTGDTAALEGAIRRIRASGSTSLYNAVYIALSGLKRMKANSPSELRRQAIIVLSDGEDTTSLVNYDEVLDSAKRSEVLVYAIGLRSKEPVTRRIGGYNEAEFVMRTLAQQTGGRAFFVDDVNQLPAIYTQIADELAAQYLIGYSSRNTRRDGAWRSIVLRSMRANTAARTKAGYFAAAH
jgi:VWFA-related protein